MSDLIGISELAELLGISYESARKAVADGVQEPPWTFGIKVLGRVKFPRGVVEKWAMSNNLNHREIT